MKKKAAALIYGDNPNYIDHLAPLCHYLKIPLLTNIEEIFDFTKKYYPNVDVKHIENKDVNFYVVKNFDNILACTPKNMFDTEFRLHQDVLNKEINIFWCPHGNSDKGRTVFFMEALKDASNVLVYGDKMIDFLKNNAVVDFVSVYDHLDLYTIEFHKYKSYIKTYDDKHWRTINSTTCTFLTTKNVLIKTKNIFKKYSKKNFFDRDIFKKNRILRHLFLDFFGRATGADYWSSLTKINIFKLFRILKFRYRNYGTWQIYFRSWRYNWRQILFGRKYYLWAPIPTIGTHMEYNFLPPTIDWDKIFKKEISEDKIGMIGDGVFDPREIDVVSIPTIVRDPKKFKNYLSKKEVMITDEVHHAQSTTWYKTIMKIPAVYRFGLTATPQRGEKFLLLEACTGKIIYTAGYDKLIEEKY
ncbi:hypothetical protein LCGC14_2106240, partial [marine sediment metagenome]